MTMWIVQAPVVAHSTLESATKHQGVQKARRRREYTFLICPVGVQIWNNGLVAHLLERLGGLVVDLEDAARPPPAATGASIVHVEESATGGLCAGVVSL